MTTITVKVDVDPDVDRVAVWKKGIGWVEMDRGWFADLLARAESVSCPRCAHPWAHHVCYHHGRGQCQCPDLQDGRPMRDGAADLADAMERHQRDGIHESEDGGTCGPWCAADIFAVLVSPA